jgi:low affinity Fe/Cu permease
MKNRFRSFANSVSSWAGSPYVFVGAMTIIIVWALSGHTFHYSDTWQLIINTGTTIITFLMVFLIQNTQNRDAKATQLKLDELIKAQTGARNMFVGLEDISDEELAEVAEEFKKMHKDAPATPALAKLRRKIEREKAKRSGLQNVGDKVIATVLNPLGIDQKSK